MVAYVWAYGRLPSGRPRASPGRDRKLGGKTPQLLDAVAAAYSGGASKSIAWHSTVTGVPESAAADMKAATLTRRGFSIAEMRRMARRTLPRAVFDFADGAAEDEKTLRRNEAAFQEIDLLPRPLDGAAERELSTTLFGRRLSLPVILGPTGLAGLFWPDGERCGARAASAAGTVYCLSHASVCSLEELADCGAAPRWMQVFVYKDRAFTQELVERATRAK